MSANIVPSEADLGEIVDQVWASYLDPDGVHPLIPAEPDKARFDVLSSVSITGSWHGHLVYACTEKAARNAAAALLAMDAAEVSQEDVADVLGELANVIGGNVKSMLPAGCFISLPHVVLAAGASNHWPAAVRVCHLAGIWLGEWVSISIWQSASDRAEA